MGQIPSQSLSKESPAGQTQWQRMLDAMVASCAEKTYAATTIADIVTRAGVSRATFYKHFANKRACLDAAVDASLEVMGAVARESASGTESGPERVRKAVTAALELMAAEPKYTRLVVIEAVSADPSLIDRFRALAMSGLKAIYDEDDRAPVSDSALRGAFGQAQVLIANKMLTEENGSLTELLPDLVYISVRPFAGAAEAMKQAQLAR